MSPDASFIDQASAVLPFSMLPHRLSYLAQKLAVVCEAPAPASLCADFVGNMSMWHPAFNFSADIEGSAPLAAAVAPLTAAGAVPFVPGFSEVTRSFGSVAELNAYVTATDYDAAWERDSAANPKIWGAIVFTSAAGDYALRLNASATPSTDGARVNVLQRFADVSVITRFVQAALDTRGPPFLLEKGNAVYQQPYPGFLTLQREVDRFLIQRAWLARGNVAPTAAPTLLREQRRSPPLFSRCSSKRCRSRGCSN